jgi:hypothetical protein
VKESSKALLITALVALLLSAWAPWMDDKAIHDRVILEKAHKDGTMGWVNYPNGTRKYELVCDYKVHWFPFGRWVASCEGGYYVTFWNQII